MKRKFGRCYPDFCEQNKRARFPSRKVQQKKWKLSATQKKYIHNLISEKPVSKEIQ